MRILQGLILAALALIAGLLFSISQKMNAPAPSPAPTPVAVQAPAPVPVPEPAPMPEVKPARKPKPSPFAAPKTMQPVVAPTPVVASPLPEPIRPAQAITPIPAEPEVRPQVIAPPPPRTLTIQAGTPFTVRLLDPIATDHNHQGDTFQATLDETLSVDGAVVAQRGARVVGRIAQLRQSGRVAGVAEMELEIDRITTVAGEMQIVTETMMREAESTKGKDAKTVGILAGIGAAIGGIAGGGKGAGIGAAAGGAAGAGDVLATRGKPVKFDREARLGFRLRAPLSITVAGDRVQNANDGGRDGRPVLVRR